MLLKLNIAYTLTANSVKLQLCVPACDDGLTYIALSHLQSIKIPGCILYTAFQGTLKQICPGGHKQLREHNRRTASQDFSCFSV